MTEIGVKNFTRDYLHAMDYLIENVGASNVFEWTITKKSLVYYLYNDEGGRGKRVVIPISNL